MCRLIDDNRPRPAQLRTILPMQFQHGIGVGQAGGLLGGHHQQLIRRRRHLTDKRVKPSPEIDNNPVVISPRFGQQIDHPPPPGMAQPGQLARAGTAGENVETARVPHTGCPQRGLPGQHHTEIALRQQAELNVHIGEAEIGIE